MYLGLQVSYQMGCYRVHALFNRRNLRISNVYVYKLWTLGEATLRACNAMCKFVCFVGETDILYMSIGKVRDIQNLYTIIV
jgi:hypothetical protein